ncbi:hypothetical protein PENSPDRAFT_669249 [Peniophora sp. CONT]|nr:hypothetical protein PENSPDRAFT_669249 [Peniophora sp. CONT]
MCSHEGCQNWVVLIRVVLPFKNEPTCPRRREPPELTSIASHAIITCITSARESVSRQRLDSNHLCAWFSPWTFHRGKRNIPIKASLPPEILCIVFKLLTAVWPAGWSKDILHVKGVIFFGLGWVTVSHCIRDAVCAFANIEAIYEYKRRAQATPFTLDLDTLLLGSVIRSISSFVDTIWRDREFFEGAGIINCTLGLDHGSVMGGDYSRPAVLGTAAWMRLFQDQQSFPALTSLTFPWTTEFTFIPTITANNLTFLRIVGVRVFFKDGDLGFRSAPGLRTTVTPRGDVGNLILFIEFLQPLINLKTLVVDRGSFALPPHEAMPIHFPQLLDVRVSSDNAAAIMEMQGHIITPLAWEIITSVERGLQLSTFIQSYIGTFDLATIDHNYSWTFITFSSYSGGNDSVAPSSMLDPKFVRHVWSFGNINLHVAADHITFAFPLPSPPHFDAFTCRRLVINRIKGRSSTTGVLTTAPRMRKDWQFLSALDHRLDHVWLCNDCPMNKILSNLRAPRRLTVNFVDNPCIAFPVEEINPRLQQWRLEATPLPSITLRGKMSSDFPSLLGFENMLDLRV